MEIQSYYKDSPENPNAFTDQSATYTFNYTYQPNESVTTVSYTHLRAHET